MPQFTSTDNPMLGKHHSNNPHGLGFNKRERGTYFAKIADKKAKESHLTHWQAMTEIIWEQSLDPKSKHYQFAVKLIMDRLLPAAPLTVDDNRSLTLIKLPDTRPADVQIAKAK